MSTISNRIFTAKLLSTRALKPHVVEYTFYLPLDFSYEPGQYIWLELLVLKANDSKGTRRAFTITNPLNKENTISFVVRIRDGGFYETLQSLHTGDEVRIHGPFGSSFVVKESTPHELVMIADEMGVAYFLGVIQSILTRKKELCCKLYVSLPDQEDHWSEPILKEVQAQTKCFQYKIFNEPFQWDMLDKVPGFNESEWWVSGDQDMVQETYDTLQENGVPRPDIHFGRCFPKPNDCLTIVDIEKEQNTNGFLFNALQSSSNHIVITDINGFILFANKAAEKITGYSFEEMKGNTPRLWGGLMGPAFYEQLWMTKLKGLTYEGEIVNRNKKGDIYYAIAHISPLFNDKCEVIGHIATEEDITEIKDMQEKLRESEELWKFALEGNMAGVWDWNYPTGQITFTPRCYQMLGRTANEIGSSINEWMDMIHDEDKELVQKVLSEFLEGKTQVFNVIHRTKAKDESWVWLLNRGKIMEYTSDKKPLRIVGTLQNMTAEKNAEEEMKKKNSELSRLNQLMVGREIRMAELKEEIAALKQSKS